MFDLTKKIFKKSSIYAFGDILTKGIGFFLIPLYTAYLSPEDYGIISLSTIIASIFTIISTGGLRSAILKFYFNFDDIEERKQFYGTLWLFYFFVPGVILLLLEFKGKYLFGYIIPSVAYHPYLRLAIWTAYMYTLFCEIPLEIFKAKSAAIKHTKFQIGIFIVTTAFTIWFIVFKNGGATGLLYAKFLGNLIIAVSASLYLFNFLRINFNIEYLKRALYFSLPMVPHFLSHWVLSSSDRIVLEYYVTLGEVGVYNVGYTIGSALAMISVAGNNAIMPLYGNLDLEDSSAVNMVIQTATYFIAIIIIIGLAISLFASDFILFAIPESYYDSIKVIPWIVLGYIFMSLYFTQINLLTITLGKTKLIGVSTTIAAILNVSLNIWFIPNIGMIGAAITTAFTYLVLFLGLMFIAKREHSLPFEFFRMFKIFIAGLITFLIINFISPENIYFSILLKLIAYIIFGFLLVVLKFFNKKEIQFLKSKIGSNEFLV